MSTAPWQDIFYKVNLLKTHTIRKHISYEILDLWGEDKAAE